MSVETALINKSSVIEIVTLLSTKMTIMSLDRITTVCAKYQDDVKLVRCLRTFFKHPNDFSLQCSNMSKSHLAAYICILCERYDAEKKYSEDVLFDVEYILNAILIKSHLVTENNVFEEMLDILAITILMSEGCDSDLTPKEVIAKIMQDFRFTDDETGALQLSVSEVVHGIYPELFSHSFQRSIATLIFSETQILHYRSLTLVRQMIISDNHATLVDYILDEIEKRKTTQCLIILSYLIDCEGLRKRFMSKSSFWLLLQQKILSTERSDRKYALYVVRKIIECQTSGLDDKLLRGSEIRAPWENFFLVQETLDEKQSHLILPVLEFLAKTKTLPMNWYYVLIIQLLRHENTLVLQSGLIYAIKNIELDVESINNGDELINELILSLINGLNNTFLYAKSDFPVEELKHFFEPIIDIVFDKFLTINWKPIPMYYIVDSIIDTIFDHNAHNNEQVAEKLIKILRLVNKVPNIHIRNGIHFNIHRTIYRISGHLSVQTFAQLAQLACAPSMKVFEFLEFDHWSQEDVITVLNHKGLCDEVKKTFLTRLEITNDDLLCLLKLMKMDDSKSFHIFEVLASLHFYTLNIWLSDTLEHVGDDLVMALSMYGTLYNVNSFQHNQDILNMIFPRNVYVHKMNKLLTQADVVNEQHIIQCIYDIYLSYKEDADIKNLLDRFIECGTTQTILAALTILEKDPKNIDEAKLTDIMRCVKDLENAAVTTRFIEMLKTTTGKQFRPKFYPQLIQMAFNQTHLLAIVVDEFLKEDDDFLVNSAKHIQNLLTYGVPLKGDQRVEYDLCQLIQTNESGWIDSSYIRCQLLLKLINGFTTGSKNLLFIQELTNYLFKLSADLNLSKPRYFADSQQHRTKLRIMQALAALLCRTQTWDTRLKMALLTENNQPNVTFILELMIGRTIEPSQLSLLLEEAKSNSARQSIFVIMYYVCSRLNQPDWATRYIENILPYTMGQHFNTRLFAQIAIVKIIEKFKFNTPNHKYKSVYDQIMQSFDQGNAKQISEKFLEDFRFTCIDCTDLLEPIYFLCEIPRATQMAKDELIPVRLLKLSDEIKNKIIFKEPFHVNINMCGTHNENVVDSAYDNVQKKIIPMKNIYPDATLLETLPNYPKNMKEPNREGLILVASLVSRSANLGGLSRTCEIFGVQQLVLDSLKHVENKEFQSLSMTSEKWLNIGEMKSFQLLDYLVSMKSKGYYIIGAEQTSNSKKLTDLKFPKKTVLLLGHEKDGVPANLLSVLDVAVEIPQFGVVRSLNVHVSGAIFVWEYAKQHNF